MMYDGIIKGSIVENKLHSTIFSLEYNGIKRVEEVKILGLFNLYNLMGVMGALINLGYDFEELCDKLGNLVGVPGRFQGVEAGQDFMVIVDYAHTPDALTNILKSLTEIKTNKIITIFGEIIDWGVKLQQYDLGDNNEQIKAENREALHSLVIAVLTGKNALINGRNELTKIIGIEKHQKRAQRRLTESYTKIIEAFEKCTIKQMIWLMHNAM